METINRFTEQYKAKRAKRKAEKLANKYKIKSFTDKWDLFNTVIKWSSYKLQTLSLLTASVFMYYTVYTQTGSMYISLASTLVLLGFFEILKRISTSTIFKTYHQENIINYSLALFVTFCMVGSIFLSYKGAPLLSEHFAPKPELIDIDKVKVAQAAKMDSMHAHWNSLINASISETEKFEDKNTIKAGKYKDQLVWGQNENLADLQKATTKHRADYATASTLLSEFHAKEIENLKAENKARLVTANSEQKTTGEFMAVCTLLFELLTVLAIAFNEYYDFRSALELEDSKLAVETEKLVSIKAVETASSAKPQQPKRAVVKGFGGQPTEGDINNGLIWYQSKRGGSWKKRSDLTRYRAAAGSAQQKQRIEQLINKLDEQA